MNEIIDSRINADKIYVNGPVNVVRLEGTIGDIKKVIYLFFDYHQKTYFRSY